MPRTVPACLVLLLALLLPACAGRQGDAAAAAATPAATDPSDPYEHLNREILDVNLAIDDAVFRPVAVFYRDTVGPWSRTRIRNFLVNINEPTVAANALLQARPLDMARSLARFGLNSTVGLAGFFDVATDEGLPQQTRDFGQTLYSWGVPDGPYLMLPFAGPSNPRDTVGMIANGFLNPINWVLPFGANVGRTVALGVDEREQHIEGLDELRSSSLDFYARLRSVWRQRRDAELGRTTAEGEGLDVLEDPAADPAAQ